MPALNEDCVRLVFDIVYNAEIFPPWQTLSNLSIVCRQWSIHAQTLMFSYVRIDKPQHLDSFLFATNPDTERGRRLGNTVKIIKLTLHGPVYVNRVASTRLPATLARCPRLYELRVSLEDVFVFSEETLEQLQNSPPILALRIRDNMTKGTAAKQLLHVWPSLRHLVLRSTSIGLHTVYEDETSPKFQLYEFRFEGNHQQSIRFIHWLLRDQFERPDPGSYLRILHLSVPLSDDSEGELASHYGPHLHSIRLLLPHLPLIQAASRLREIYLRHDEDLTEGLFALFPPSIEHIACTTQNNRTMAVERILQWKELGKGLRGLKVITLYCPKAEERQESWDYRWNRLCMRARKINVDIVRQDDRSFLVGGSEDLVAARRFPRPTTIHQFEQMSYALDNLPTAYLATEDDVRAPGSRARSPLPSRPISRSYITPYIRRNSSSTNLELGQPIILDQTVVTPRKWDYDNDRPLERIVLDDPKEPRSDLWRKTRHSFRAFRKRLEGSLSDS